MISAIQAAVARWEDPQPGELRSIFILAAMEGQRLEVQAARDGFLDPELTQTLAELAHRTDVSWEGGLLDRLVADAGDEEGVLKENGVL